MPPQTSMIPRTHAVTVDLGQVYLNIQRAITNVYNGGGTLHRDPDYSPENDRFGCHIGTMNELRDFLQPALTNNAVQYVKKWHKEYWLHLLTFSDDKSTKQHILISPTFILNTAQDQQCSIDQGLAYYLSVGLDVTPPTLAKDSIDAAMVGYIRCFGAGNLDCPQYLSYAPPIAPAPAAPLPPAPPQFPNIEKMLRLQALTSKAPNPKVGLLYISRAAREALVLANAIYLDVQKEKTTAQDVKHLITQFTPQFNVNYEGPYDEELTRFKVATQKFLTALFATTAWQQHYDRFRSELLSMGCVEFAEDQTGTRRVDCTKFGYQFTVRATKAARVTKSN